MDGFLPTRASLMLDVVFLAMFLVVPVMGASIWLVRYRQKYQLHKTIQLLLGSVLLVAVAAFEIDMQLFTQWEDLAAESPYFSSDAKWSSPVGIALIVHLCFAVPTAFLWVYVIVGALRKFPSPPEPNAYSAHHRVWGRIAAIEMTMTAATGWIFYWMAFVA